MTKEPITPNMKSSKFLIVLCYLTLYVVWGSTYFFIKMAVETIPPFYVIGLRFIVGSALLLGLALAGKRLSGWPTLRQLAGSLLIGTLLLVGGNGLITVAEQDVDSYLAALVIASTPMVVAFFDRVLLGKRISPVNAAGIAIGIGGVALLLYNGGSFLSSLTPSVLLVLAGVGCWGLATSLGHKIKGYPDPLVNSAIQMLLMGVLCTVGSLVLYPPVGQIIPGVTLSSVLALLYLSTMGSLAFAAYTYLIANEPAIRVVSYSLVNPVIATLLGLVVGNESPVPLLAAGLPLVLLGVSLMLYGETALHALRRRFGRTVPLPEEAGARIRGNTSQTRPRRS
jgi:drug/metabolite transporter (DMT)-like permease